MIHSFYTICFLLYISINHFVSASVPIIDISPFFHGSTENRLEVARKISDACHDVGFFVITGHGIDKHIIDNVWSSTRAFFDLEEEYKNTYETKSQKDYPFGYCPIGGEDLKRGKAAESASNATETSSSTFAPDLKEMFSLGPSNPNSGFPAREFPSQPTEFEPAWTAYYSTLETLAGNILSAFALALGLPDERFFDQYLDHHASAIRALNYPRLPVGFQPAPGQVRASAHTDYGAITILRTDGPGLQVSKDLSPPVWVDVPFVQDGFVINLGDLMKRWTNDYFLSTLHRVVILSPSTDQTCGADEAPCAKTGQENTSTSNENDVARRRQSIAFFVNVNRDAQVSTLPSPLIESFAVDKVKYEPIIAGDFLLLKHIAAQKQ